MTHHSIENSREQNPHETEALAEHPEANGRRANQRGSDTLLSMVRHRQKKNP